MIDISESYLNSIGILDTILYNHTSSSNIIWGTSGYDTHSEKDKILSVDIIGENEGIIKPRNVKAKEEQKNRTKGFAEVFTPSWVCNIQNNYADEQWYLKHDKSDWEVYVKSNRIEITCGEAPYLVSRYDTVTGDYIEVKDRIGMLDRKLEKICQNCNSFKTWYKWVVIAYKSTYGYEWQGDSLLLARENLLYTYIDYYKYKWGEDKNPSISELSEIASIISWNIIQMDGITFNIPMTNIPAIIIPWSENDFSYSAPITFKSIATSGTKKEKKAKKKKNTNKNEMPSLFNDADFK